MTMGIKLAKDWRESQDEKRYKSSGFVLIWYDEVCGWQKELSKPDKWMPGVKAVSLSGEIYEAVGGDDQDGAEKWVPVAV